ncbi:MAG: chemotaxis protein methyltransferase CheR [Sulfitobacter sp.]|jgi:chemotaxis protein methyltransferase CheR
MLAQSGILLDQESFNTIADLAYRESGLTLVAEKTSMIQSRLRHRLRALDIQDFPAYCAVLKSEDGQSERKHLISALTTNVSHFFRETHHFDSLAELFGRASTRLKAGGRMRIWSAGCSNGQEAISTALTLFERAKDLETLDLRILGTDIDQQVVQFARTAVYPARLMRGVPEQMIARYFDPQTLSDGEAAFELRPEVKRMLQFNTLNLLGDWPMRTRFDVIFCRNVVIYFDAETQNRLWPRFREALDPEGLLFLGHSERIPDPEKFGFECIGPTTYRPCAL